MRALDCMLRGEIIEHKLASMGAQWRVLVS